jgi:hypothetical protein
MLTVHLCHAKRGVDAMAASRPPSLGTWVEPTGGLRSVGTEPMLRAAIFDEVDDPVAACPRGNLLPDC